MFFFVEESSNPTSDEEFNYPSGQRTNPLDLNSPDSINEGAALPPVTSFLDVLSPTKTDIPTARRHPSPYYYGDLFKYRTEQPQQSPRKASVEKNQSLKDFSKKTNKSSKRHRKSDQNIVKDQKEKASSVRSRLQLRLCNYQKMFLYYFNF